MKVLSLRFKNLNSLHGEWSIDFSDPEFIANGIFALTGPTGAGKSTLLDAICLGLYGATPRLGKITKSGNEIMSRQTGECFAEVLFECSTGRFLCHWGQHRARKKANGNLADARHEISDAVTGMPIETQKSRVAAVIEEKTGMDFDRFTRSILLAQGGFDTFLKADAEQKSRILEQITGTDIYTTISCRIHERLRDEKEKLNLLQAETAGIVILGPEQELELCTELSVQQKLETELGMRISETVKAMAWLTTINDLKQEIRSLTEESDALNAEGEGFKPQRDRLARAMKAAELDGMYATVTEVRKQQDADRAALEKQRIRLPDREALADQSSKALATAEQVTNMAKEALKTASPLIQKVRFLDQSLADKKKTLCDGDSECRAEADHIEAEQKLNVRDRVKRDAAIKNLKRVDDYLETHARDAWLISGLTGIEEQLGHLVCVQTEIRRKEADRAAAEQGLTTAALKLETCVTGRMIVTKELEDIGARIAIQKEQLAGLLGGKPLREYREKKESLLREMALRQTIADLETERSRLEDGKACPLCGATEHPFARGNVPEMDEIEQTIAGLTAVIEQAEEQETALKDSETVEKAAGQTVVDSEKRETQMAHEAGAMEKRLADVTRDIQDIKTRYDQVSGAIRRNLDQQGFVLNETEPESTIRDLRTRVAVWQDHVTRRVDIEKQVADLDRALEKREAVLETRRKTLADKRAFLETVRASSEATGVERQALFGCRNPDDEEARLNSALAEAEGLEKKVRNDDGQARQALESARVNVAVLNERIETRARDLRQLEQEFNGVLKGAEFSDEHAFLEARLAFSDRDTLTARAKRLDDRQTELKVRQSDRNMRLTEALAKQVTELTLDQLEPAYAQMEGSLKQLREVIAGLKHRLAENASAQDRIKDKQGAIEARKSECRRWEKLHALIGSADGKKYRNFAQGLTFERMVSYANRQLEKMTDRYRLIRDEEQPLALNVIDNYQAGEIRSTKNLSGGESFIVSLTLALGLSNMASRKVRVDSLFLDEGFGSLDEETLETALETLAGLHQDGKLIGVISHVSALKERIGTQITITPISGGRSVLSGPGCRRGGEGCA